MIYSILYLVLALLGLGFLVFIHELGHYFMARKVGMRVEAFGIGFGKPIYSWERQGVKWNLCWLPFGGYVRIAGMEKQGPLEPHMIPDGFFGRPPWARIKVALMGPLVNIVFAFVAFCLIWGTGGRTKSFSEHTHLIGWVEPQSAFHELGLRPGDEITAVNNRPFNGFADFIYAMALDNKNLEISGHHIDYATQEKKPFTLQLDSQKEGKGDISYVGGIAPASYLFMGPQPLKEGAPIAASGIRPGDRILWVNGSLVFSVQELSAIVNEPKSLLTVRRGDQVILCKVPRVRISDLRLSETQQAELDDWQHEADLKTKVDELYFIPYNLTADAVVQGPIAYIDERSEKALDKESLSAGDRILAVDGSPLLSSFELLSKIQMRRVQIIVERNEETPVISWKLADAKFESSIHVDDLNRITSSLGTQRPITALNRLVLLNPVVPVASRDLPLTKDEKAWRAQQLSAHLKQIDKIENPQEKEYALRMLQDQENKLMLGFPAVDEAVIYNPTPMHLFSDVFDQIARTLKALVTGYVSPKGMAGPVGIVQIIQHGWSLGVKEALYWMGLISLNLAMLNLLPLPVLDGGHILFAAIEKVTGKPIKAKTMEKLVVPFVVLLVIFFIYFTFQDLSRIFSRFF